MYAIRQYELGGPDVLQFEEVLDLEPAAGQVRLAVSASGVHVIDTYLRRGFTSSVHSPPNLPMTPGREVAGRVDAIGAGVDETWMGKRVVAHLGQASGGYAEQAVARAASLHEIPEGMPCAVAVAAIGTGRTAVGILEQSPIEADDVVLVTSAAGGLGVLLIQAARHAGARVVGLAGGSKATLVFDAVGGEVGQAAYDLLAPGGRIFQYGWYSDEPPVYADPARPATILDGPAMVTRPGGLRPLVVEALELAASGARVPLVGSTFALTARSSSSPTRRWTNPDALRPVSGRDASGFVGTPCRSGLVPFDLGVRRSTGSSMRWASSTTS